MTTEPTTPEANARRANKDRDLLIRLFSTANANRNLTEGDSDWAWREYQRLTAVINAAKEA